MYVMAAMKMGETPVDVPARDVGYRVHYHARNVMELTVQMPTRQPVQKMRKTTKTMCESFSCYYSAINDLKIS